MIRPDLDDLARMSEDALRLIDPDDLAFYFASGKSEDLIRDHIATFMHKNLSLSGPEYVTREWKRHDLGSFMKAIHLSDKIRNDCQASLLIVGSDLQ